jgi:tetratricopeptide (TPR) repeat protein
MTDDRPWAEFAAPKEVYASTVDVSLRDMMPFYENPRTILRFSGMTEASVQEAADRLDRRYRAHIKDLEGEIAYYGAGAAMGDPAARFKEALAIDPNDLTAPFYIKEIAMAQAAYYLGEGRVARAVDVLTDAIRYAPNQTALYAELGDIYHRRLEQDDKALEHYEAYLEAGGRSERIAKLCETIRASLNASPPGQLSH